MCEHKNLRTVGDRLFCKDCKTELPLEFLYKGQEEASAEPEEVIQEEAPAEVNEEVITEPVQEEQEAGEKAPVSEEQCNSAPKNEKAKTRRKTAKKEV